MRIVNAYLHTQGVLFKSSLMWINATLQLLATMTCRTFDARFSFEKDDRQKLTLLNDFNYFFSQKHQLWYSHVTARDANCRMLGLYSVTTQFLWPSHFVYWLQSCLLRQIASIEEKIYHLIFITPRVTEL